METEKNCELPVSVALHLTEACNLRCKMCYEWGTTGSLSTAESKKKPQTLEFDLIRDLVQALSPRTPFYSLFGGEPLLYPRLEELILLIKDAGSYIDTPTNGTLLAKNADLLVKTGFDSIRVSIDGPKQANDGQRGRGSYDRAMAGIESLYQKREAAGSSTPAISIIYTVTPDNHDVIEQFFLDDIDLRYINGATIQTQNFVTQEMGDAYGRMLESEFKITSSRHWRGFVRSVDDFSGMDIKEMTRQINKVQRAYKEMGKRVLALPPTMSAENLDAYYKADWGGMTDVYRTCMAPWSAVDITAAGDVAPCHTWYDLVLGNLHTRSFEDIWNGEAYSKFRAHMKKNGLMPICSGCCILYLIGVLNKKGGRAESSA